MKKKFSAVAFLCFLFAGIPCLGQSTIYGTITDRNNNTIGNANVLLLQFKDSVLVKGTITSSSGAYSFENIPVQKYLVVASISGYDEAYIPAFTIIPGQHNTDLGKLSLSPSVAQLNSVTVTAKKLMYEQKIDRLVINVAASITSAGNTALEVLEKSPGVLVDHQNNSISMNGKNGVVVMMNGKINYMPLSAVVQLLAGMSSGNIEKIELITTPPANFDAEGNAGFINIVLKENNNLGTNGAYSATLGYGKGMVSGANANFNHRNRKINLYGDVSYSRVKKPFTSTVYSNISNAGNITETYFTGNRTDTVRNINGRIGIDIEVKKHTIIGALVSAYNNRYSQAELNGNTIVKNSRIDTTVQISNNEINQWSNYGVNLNVQHQFRENENLFVNFDLIHYSNDQPVQYLSSYYNNLGNLAYVDRRRSGKLTPITFRVGSLDYTKQLAKNMFMEAGFKETISTFTNDISLDRFQQNVWTKDNALSAKYKLNENYTAAYVSLKISVNKTTDAKMGVRYEYTNSNLGTAEIKNIVDRHYGNLFPSLFLSHKTGENSSVNFSYSMRITRPKITDLAPFTYYLNANTLITGNPSLQASVSTTYKTDFSYKNYLASISYSNEKYAITGFQPSSDSITNKIVYTPQNLANQKTVAAILSLPLNINKWWRMQYNATGIWQQVNAFYKNLPVRFEQLNFQLSANQNFKLPKDYSIELSGFYQSPLLNGIFLTKPNGSVDLGIKKKLPGKNGSLVFNAGNIFNTLQFSGSAVLPEQNLNTNLNLQFSRRTLKLTYSRNFGKEKLKGKRDRVTGAEEAKERVQ